jgi:two-component system, sensor histidine kinase
MNGRETVELATTESFDLILMDLHMPEMDGEDATRIIRSNIDEKINKIPIVALTANASTDTQKKLLDNGFNNYISKPFNPENLFKILKKYYHEN